MMFWQEQDVNQQARPHVSLWLELYQGLCFLFISSLPPLIVAHEQTSGFNNKLALPNKISKSRLNSAHPNTTLRRHRNSVMLPRPRILLVNRSSAHWHAWLVS